MRRRDDGAIRRNVLEPFRVANEEALVRGVLVEPVVARERVSRRLVRERRRSESSVRDHVVDEVPRIPPYSGGAEAQIPEELRLERHVELVGARMLDVVADAVDLTRDEHLGRAET